MNRVKKKMMIKRQQGVGIPPMPPLPAPLSAEVLDILSKRPAFDEKAFVRRLKEYMERDQANKARPRWHYTDYPAWLAIQQEGFIRATAVQESGPYVTWVSSNREWEAICRATLNLGIDAHARGTAWLGPEFAQKAVRIQVDTRIALPWQEYLESHGISPFETLRLYQVGMEQGSRPEQWFIVGGNIDRSDWIEVELWDGRRWHPLYINHPQ